jgi:hypothetical protein
MTKESTCTHLSHSLDVSIAVAHLNRDDCTDRIG